MKLFLVNNFETFSFFLIKNRFFYKFSFNTSQIQLSTFYFFPFSKISIPFSKKFSNPKSILNYYNFVRSSFYGLKLFYAKPIFVYWFKNYYSFSSNIQGSKKISFLISFFKKFRRKNYKLFFRSYFTKNRRLFRFYLRDSHIFTNLSSNVFDYYNWQNRVQFNFHFSNDFHKSLALVFDVPELCVDFQNMLLYQYFNFSNKKIS